MDPRAVAERALRLFFVARPPSPRGGAAEELARLLRDASARALRVVERFSRDRRAHDRLGLPFADLRVEDLDGLAAEPAPMGLLAMATMARSGYVRQAAIQRLDEHVEPLTFGLLLSRLNDPVRFVAAAADAALRRHLVHLQPVGLVRYLPLLDALDSWKRSRDHAIVPLVEARLESLAGAAALREATTDRDVDLRLAALRRQARQTEGHVLEAVLRDALGARDPRVRLWAAQAASDAADEVRDALLPVMADNRTPAIRLTALRAMRRSATHEHRLVRACFDPNANVRLYARLAVRDRRLDHAARARSILRDADAPKGDLVGALAVLSDLGTREDLALVRPFADDGRASVAAEAERTVALLTA